jgi:hypothetical protein
MSWRLLVAAFGTMLLMMMVRSARGTVARREGAAVTVAHGVVAPVARGPSRTRSPTSPTLQVLYVRDNLLNGTIPASLSALTRAAVVPCRRQLEAVRPHPVVTRRPRQPHHVRRRDHCIVRHHLGGARQPRQPRDVGTVRHQLVGVHPRRARGVH